MEPAVDCDGAAQKGPDGMAGQRLCRRCPRSGGLSSHGHENYLHKKAPKPVTATGHGQDETDARTACARRSPKSTGGSRAAPLVAAKKPGREIVRGGSRQSRAQRQVAPADRFPSFIRTVPSASAWVAAALAVRPHRTPASGTMGNERPKWPVAAVMGFPLVVVDGPPTADREFGLPPHPAPKVAMKLCSS